MRCKACNKPLSDAEILRSPEDFPEYCWECTSKALSEYDILTDKVYQFQSEEIPIKFEKD